MLEHKTEERVRGVLTRFGGGEKSSGQGVDKTAIRWPEWSVSFTMVYI